MECDMGDKREVVLVVVGGLEGSEEGRGVSGTLVSRHRLLQAHTELLLLLVNLQPQELNPENKF